MIEGGIKGGAYPCRGKRKGKGARKRGEAPEVQTNAPNTLPLYLGLYPPVTIPLLPHPSQKGIHQTNFQRLNNPTNKLI